MLKALHLRLSPLGLSWQTWLSFWRVLSFELTRQMDYTHSADKASVLELFSPLYPNVLSLTNKIKDILYWRIFDSEPLETFVHGKTLLLETVVAHCLHLRPKTVCKLSKTQSEN